MKAVLMTATGAPDTLAFQDIKMPEITEATQVKIKLHAAAVNPVDTKIRRNGIFYPGDLPVILGCDGAGVIVEIGSAVNNYQAGDKVWFCHGGLGREQGNYAEYTVIDQRWVSAMPQKLSFVEAASLPLVLITAWGALYDRGGLQPGQTVLIHAGAGGVGHVAIQLAKLAGASVITTVSSEAKAEFATRLGADYTILYKQHDVAKLVAQFTDNQGADLVIDTVGAEVFTASIPLTAHFGRLITLLDPGPIDLKEARMRNLLIGFELMLTPMLRNLNQARDHHIEILNQCARWLDQGQLKPHISQQMPLQAAKHAHQLIEAGHTSGKIVLVM
jgi:NADPH2:quinone reductase